MSASQSSSGPNSRCYEVVGTRPIRHDGVEKVMGQAHCRRPDASHAIQGTAMHGTTERHSENGVQEGRDGMQTPGEVLTNV